MNQFLEKNNNVLNTIILLFFIFFSLLIGIHHEPWADEAQAWLIARDASVYDIIFNISKYEGSPVMWQLLLKLLITLGFQYKYYYLIPLFFSSIGIYILLFKLKINNLYKILLPFTYFIGFEYTIKARSYCFLLPILSIIAMLYDKREKNIFTYNFMLLLLSYVSLHGTIISGILFLFEIIEVLRKVIIQKSIKNAMKEIISIYVCGVFYCFLVYTIIPTSDIYVYFSFLGFKKENKVVYFIFLIFKILEAFVLKNNYYKLYLIAICYVVMLFTCVIKNNKRKRLFLSIFFTEVIFICIIRISNHHIGIIFYSFIFSVYLVKDGIEEKFKPIFRVLLSIMLVIQAVWYFNSAIADIYNDFSASKEVANYLKSLDYENKKIYASGFYVTSILPYFNNNIFYGDRGQETFYIWSRNNNDWIIYSSKDYLYFESNINEADIIVLDNHYETGEDDSEKKAYSVLIDNLKKSDKYSTKLFDGKIIFKDLDENSDNEGFYVFERIK